MATSQSTPVHVTTACAISLSTAVAVLAVEVFRLAGCTAVGCGMPEVLSAILLLFLVLRLGESIALACGTQFHNTPRHEVLWQQLRLVAFLIR